MIWYWPIIILVLIFGLVVFRGSPYVPSHKSHIRQSFTDLYKLSSKDLLVDIGSGDGIILREASKRGARAVGYEINPLLVLLSRILSRNDKRVSVRFTDFWLSHLPDDTTVVYVFSVSRDINKLNIMIQNEANRLGRKLYLISYASKFGGKKVQKKVGAHYLYLFNPLQPAKAQV